MRIRQTDISNAGGQRFIRQPISHVLSCIQTLIKAFSARQQNISQMKLLSALAEGVWILMKKKLPGSLHSAPYQRSYQLFKHGNLGRKLGRNCENCENTNS